MKGDPVAPELAQDQNIWGLGIKSSLKRKLLGLLTEAFKVWEDLRPDNSDLLAHLQGAKEWYDKELQAGWRTQGSFIT